MPRLRVALGEYDTGWHDPALSVQRARQLVARAAEAGARLVLLPEMCTTGFSMEPGEHAEALGGAQSSAFAAMAREYDLWILAGLAMVESADPLGPACSTRVNAAVLFGPSGEVESVYRKQRLFAMAGENEHYASGDEPLVISIDGLRVSPFICYDLRFPELFRAVAPDVDAFLLIANWPKARAEHWDALVKARAIENLCYVVAVNRIGEGDGIIYDGRSVAYGPWGDELPDVRTGREAAAIGAGPRVVELDAARVAETRTKFPFLDDQDRPIRREAHEARHVRPFA